MSREFNQYINQLTSSMLQSYHANGEDVANSSARMPSRNTIIKILNELRGLFYPRHFGEREFFNCTIQYYVGNLMMSIEEMLYQQVRLSLLLKNEQTHVYNEKELGSKAAEISCSFMQTIPKIRTALSQDVQAAYDGDPAAQDKDQIIYSYPGVFTMMVYRVAHELRKLDVPLIPRIMSEYAHSRSGIDINPGAEIGKNFFMDHGTGIVIGETTKIGNNVKLYQGVTLGALSTQGGQKLSGVRRHPTIEDNVTIYSNCSILGGETIIGHDSIIGGNAFITQSVPPFSKVSAVQAELRVKDGAPQNLLESFDWVI